MRSASPRAAGESPLLPASPDIASNSSGSDAPSYGSESHHADTDHSAVDDGGGRPPSAGPSAQLQPESARRLDVRHVFRHKPLHHQDGMTYQQRRQRVLERRKEHHNGFLRDVRRKWDDIAEAERQRLERARRLEEMANDESSERLRAWAPALILALHFGNAFEEEAVKIKATTNLRFFLLPLVWKYLKRLRQRLSLRHAFIREAKAKFKPKIPLAAPGADFLRHASPMLSKWPDDALTQLGAKMLPRYFFKGTSVFLRGELSRTSFVHFIARGIVSVADMTEQAPTREELNSMRAFGGYGAVQDVSRSVDAKQEKCVIQAGLLIGEYAAVVGEAFRDSFVAVTDIITYSIESETFLEILATLPSTVQADALNIAKARYRRRVAQHRPSIDDIRASHPFFAGWPNEAVISTLECFMPVVLRKGERAFRDARTSHRVLFVQHGEIGLFTKQKLVRTIGAGTMVGTSSIVPVQPPHFGVEPVASTLSYFEGWSIQRPELVSIITRYHLDDKLVAEYNRVVKPVIPRPSQDELRRPKVLHFLPDKSAAALINILHAEHVREGTTLARQDTVATDYYYVVWGTLQLIATDARSREKKSVGELHPGDSFGSAEVIASATCAVSLVAPHSCIVLSASADEVYHALELGGPNVVISALERANQLVGNRSAVARQKMEAEYHRANVATMKDDPKYRVEEARKAALARIHAVRQQEQEAAARAESSHMKEQQSVIDRLTTDAKRARELQKLAVEHRVFACIKDQVFGGRRHEHTVLVSNYYATPMDEHDPVFAAPEQRLDMTALAVGKPELARAAAEGNPDRDGFGRMTGGAFTIDDDGALTLVDAEAARTNLGTVKASSSGRPRNTAESARSGTQAGKSRSSDRNDKPVSLRAPAAAVAATQSVGSDPEMRDGANLPSHISDAFLTETAAMRRELSGDLQDFQDELLRSVSAASVSANDESPRSQEVLSEKLSVSDPLPYLRAPPPPAQGKTLHVRPRPDDTARIERRRLLTSVAERSAQRREDYKRQLDGMFAIPRRGAGVEPPAQHETAVRQVPPVAPAAMTAPKLPQSSRLAHVDEAGRQSSPAPETVAPKRAPRPPRPAAQTARPSRRTPDMSVTVDPSKTGRAAGNRSIGKLQKGKPHDGIVPRPRPVGPVPAAY